MAAPRLRQEDLRKVKILYEDDDLIVVDKPAGLAVHGGADTKGRDLLTVLAGAYPVEQPLFLAHRLDRGTSGVLLVLKRSELTPIMQGLWPSAHKRYLALVIGAVENAQTVDTPLETKDGRRQTAKSRVTPVGAGGQTAKSRVTPVGAGGQTAKSRVTPVGAGGQTAKSRVTPVGAAGGLTLVEVDIVTGRQHQIRRHLAAIGHPVFMDDKYGDFAANKALAKARPAEVPRPKHLFLHAARLQATHPQHGVPQTFEAPMPEAWTPWLS